VQGQQESVQGPIQGKGIKSTKGTPYQCLLLGFRALQGVAKLRALCAPFFGSGALSLPTFISSIVTMAQMLANKQAVSGAFGQGRFPSRAAVPSRGALQV
jgi:hypothetical protein